MKRALIFGASLVPLAAVLSSLLLDDPWSTADQRGMRAFQREAYSEAAAEFLDANWRGVALYRAGNFKDAGALLSGVPGADAAYNRGNALVMQGLYEEAVASYGRALEERPEWEEARLNQALADSRWRKETALGEKTELGADDIVFNPDMPEGGDSVEVTEGGALSSEDMRALWLRNVQTKPGDFLRSKFSYQRAMEGSK